LTLSVEAVPITEGVVADTAAPAGDSHQDDGQTTMRMKHKSEAATINNLDCWQSSALKREPFDGNQTSKAWLKGKRSTDNRRRPV
jgi:hypothetical protein